MEFKKVFLLALFALFLIAVYRPEAIPLVFFCVMVWAAYWIVRTVVELARRNFSHE